MTLSLLAASRRIARRAAPRRSLFLLMALGLVAIGAIFVEMMADARDDARRQAETAGANLATAISEDLDRNIELLNLSIGAARDGWMKPQVRSLSPDLRQLVLFDQSAKAHHIDAILVLDSNGDVVADSRTDRVLPKNFADRDFFRAQVTRHDGLFVSKPFMASQNGWCMAFSQRMQDADGHFAGAAVGILHLSYVGELYRRLRLGRNGALALFNTDGTLLVRDPPDPQAVGRSFATGGSFDNFETEISGSFEGKSPLDGKTRLISFHRIGDLPLVQSVGVSLETVYAEWWSRVVPIGGVLAALCSGIMGLMVVIRRELAQRIAAQKELSDLATRDSLTGLLNRRGFFDRAGLRLAEATRTRESAAVLMIDADHFKGYNDRYGHVAGDAVLAAIGRCIADEICPATDLAARFGGEEFIVFLTGADSARASRTAEAIRSAVAHLGTPHDRATLGVVTISVGFSTTGAAAPATLAILVEAADEALYRAKRGGRNRVCSGLVTREAVPRMRSLTA